MSSFDKEITVFKTAHCDTRTLEEGKKFEEYHVYKDTVKHVNAVIDAGGFIKHLITNQFNKHDYTKVPLCCTISDNKNWFNNYLEALNSGLMGQDFKNLPWYQEHISKERHHLNENCPEDVNLIDVLEMICDTVVAGMARTGEIFPINLDNEILQKAVQNTVKLIKDNVVVKE